MQKSILKSCPVHQPGQSVVWSLMWCMSVSYCQPDKGFQLFQDIDPVEFKRHKNTMQAFGNENMHILFAFMWTPVAISVEKMIDRCQAKPKKSTKYQGWPWLLVLDRNWSARVSQKPRARDWFWVSRPRTSNFHVPLKKCTGLIFNGVKNHQ